MSSNPNIVQASASQAAAPAARQVAEAREGFRLSPYARGIVVRQVLLQIFLIIVTITVMFPILWIISMAIDPRGITRPIDLNLFPPNANLNAFVEILNEPFSNVLPVYFGDLLVNSLFIALGVALATVTLGASAAYAFSRFRFIGRQAGMLGFIILLMLPATGTLIPLYIMFNSVRVSSLLAAIVPSFFVGLLVAGLVFVLFNVVRSWGKYDPERWFNPGPVFTTIGVAVIALVAIVVTFVAIFQRTPDYNTFIAAPLAQVNAAYDAAKADYDQRVQSVQQRQQTALRREERAQLASENLANLESLQARLADQTDAQAIAATMQAEIDGRLALYADNPSDAEDDLMLTTLQIALPILETGGVAGFQAGLDSAVESARAEVESVVSGAATARANADEAAANLVTAEQTLADARAASENEGAGYIALRNNAIIAALPQMLLAWAAALAAAAGLWLIMRALSGTIEPKTFLSILLFALMAALIIGIGLTQLQSRMSPATPPTQALRTTLLGLAIAFASGGLPFAIWNLKGYFDTIPKELEEAALIDGAGLVGTFIRVMIPLSLPAFAIVILFAFMQGWTEFILSWVFLTGETQSYTLAMALATLTNGANQAPPDMQKFAAMAILISLPVIILFFAFQRWIVGGLSLGGVKG